MLLCFSIAFQPATDGQTKLTIHTLEDTFPACALDFKKVWDEQLVLIKFSYKNNYNSSIRMAPWRRYMEGSVWLCFAGKTLMSH